MTEELNTVAKLFQYDNGERHVVFWCQPCDTRHHVRVLAPGGIEDHTCWTFNGDMKRPTITPSIKAERFWGRKQEHRVCHSYVTEGAIAYLSDCTHELAGQTVRLPTVNDDPHDDQ